MLLALQGPRLRASTTVCYLLIWQSLEGHSSLAER